MQSENTICTDTATDSEAISEKWSCEFCTYDNYIASLRCSMCRTPRTPATKLIFENHHNQNAAGQRKMSSGSLFGTADIFKLGSSTTTSPSTPTPTPSNNNIQKMSRSSSPLMAQLQNEVDHAKWSCQVCTFLNWPRSIRCTQCMSPRRRVSPVVSRNSPMSPRQLGSGGIPPVTACALSSPTSPPLSIHSSEQIPLQICINNFSNKHLKNQISSPCVSPPIAPQNSAPSFSTAPLTTHMESMKITTSEVNNERNRNIISQDKKSGYGEISPTPSLSASAQTTPSCGAASTSKWSCCECTYENWPRTQRCVLCGTLRNQTQKPSRNEEEQQRDEEVTRTNCDVTTRRETPSPQGASSARSHNSLADVKPANNFDYERRLRQLRRRLREADLNWLTACMGVVEGDMNPVEAYLNSGGDVTRKLTNPEVALLNRPNMTIFEAGHTLVHLAIKFHREDMLATLLSQFDGGSGGGARVKCVPSYVAPDLGAAIRRHISQALRQRKGTFPCFFINEFATYTLPPEIEDLPPGTQEQLYSELMDRDAQRELEEESHIINWSQEVRVRLGSRLHALWNRSAGDCLLDSVLQATWGVFDRDNTLRRAMADSLHEAGHIFYPRWRDWEVQQALELDYTLDEGQLAEDWAGLLNLASQPGASLEQLHVFCLAHVLRRPIIVYGVKYVKSWRGENLGLARFEGVYLPFLWESSFCSPSPIALGYTRGHFCALVPPEPATRQHLQSAPTCGRLGAAAPSSMFGCSSGDDSDKSTFLPLTTSEDDGKQILPIHFLSVSELGNEEMILRQWLDVCVTDSGLIVARQRVSKPPLLVAQMTEEWLNHYRKLAQSTSAPFASRTASGAGGGSSAPTRSSPISGSNQCYSSDGDSDEE